MPCTRGWRRGCRRTSTPTPPTSSTRAAEAREPALIVALDSVTDPRNLGAVVRSAAGFGAHGVLIPERRAAGMTASAWKTSAGAAVRVPVAQAVNLVRQLKAYQDAGCMVVGLAADGDVSLPDLDLATGPLVVVVGSEGKGLSRLVAETCDRLVSIPMACSLESLNAGVAASVALYAIDPAPPPGAEVCARRSACRIWPDRRDWPVRAERSGTWPPRSTACSPTTRSRALLDLAREIADEGAGAAGGRGRGGGRVPEASLPAAGQVGPAQPAVRGGVRRRWRSPTRPTSRCVEEIATAWASVGVGV